MKAIRSLTWIIMLVLSTIALYNYQQKMQLERDLLRTRAVMDSTVKVARQQYMTQAAESERLNYDNARLKATVEKLRSKEKVYLRLLAEYRTRLDTIRTVDTVYVDSTSGSSYHERRFDVWVVPNELRFRGRFQVQEPYNLYIDELYLHLQPEIVLTQDNRGVWSAIVDTHSDLLEMNDINLQVRPYRKPFIDLRPRVYFWYTIGWPQSEMGLTATVRIWRVQPFGLLSTQRVQIGVQARIW